MMRGINDQAWRADLLADVLHVVRRLGLGARQPDPAQPDARARSGPRRDPADEREFVRRLEAKGVPTTVRDTRGREIDGACGQLAAAES